MILFEKVLMNILWIMDPVRLCWKRWAPALEKFTHRSNIAYKLQGVSGVNHRPLVYHLQSSPTPPLAGEKTGLKQALGISLNFQSLYTKSTAFFPPFFLQLSSSPTPTLGHSLQGNCPIIIYIRSGMSCSRESENTPRSAEFHTSLPALTSSFV